MKLSPDQTVYEYIGRGAPINRGLKLGVEIEVENVQYPIDVSGWQMAGDGSLRNNGCEYIFHGPADLATTYSRIDAFGEALNKLRSEGKYTYQHSLRTSTHVHINVEDMTIGQLRKLFATYLCLEDALFDAFGAERRRSPYSCPLRESPGTVHNMTDQPHSLDKYGALATNRLADLGTVELRLFRGTCDTNELRRYVDACAGLHSASHTVATVADTAMMIAENTGLNKDLVHSDGELLMAACYKIKNEQRPAWGWCSTHRARLIDKYS